MIILETLQSSFVYGHMFLKAEANLRSSSLIFFKIRVLTLLHSAVALLIYGLTHLNLLVGTFATLFLDIGAGDEGYVRGMGYSSVGECASLTSYEFLTTSSL